MSETSQPLERMNAIVTGAAGGIGWATAQLLARQGAGVGLVDLQSTEEHAAELAARHPGQRFAAYALDIRSEEAVRQTVEDFVGEFGSIDILINNAGTVGRKGLDQITAEEWQRDIDTNLGGTVNFTKAAVYPHMLSAGSGSIVNTSSISGINGGAPSTGEAGARSGPAYAASKGGIIAFTKWVAKELGRSGIRCNSVAPGPVASPMTGGQDYDLSGQAIDRMGTADEIAQVIVFLASPAAGFMTGQIVRVDGGAVMA